MSPAERLLEIQEEMLNLLDEAENIIRRHGSRHCQDASKSYWIPQIKMGLTDDHEYLGNAGYSMQRAIDSMPDDVEEDEEECEEEEQEVP